MAAELTQEHRIASLDTPLGENVLVAVRFEGTEGISELFDFRIEARSKQAGIDFDQAVGKNCSLTFKTYQKKPDRIFNGVLVQAQGLGAQADIFSYRLILRPWLWLLSRTSDCRIFKGKAPAIIERVFTDRGFSHFRDGTSGSFPELEYCVQYRETDLAFVSRLMEQHGIYYFF
jgi:type VI secretion system secreted protein VgrG